MEPKLTSLNGFFEVSSPLILVFLFSLSIVVNYGNIIYYNKWLTPDSFVYFALLLNLLSTEKLKQAKRISKCQANYFCPCFSFKFCSKICI